MWNWFCEDIANCQVCESLCYHMWFKSIHDRCIMIWIHIEILGILMNDDNSFCVFTLAACVVSSVCKERAGAGRGGYEKECHSVAAFTSCLLMLKTEGCLCWQTCHLTLLCAASLFLTVVWISGTLSCQSYMCSHMW